ncbi:MAG: Plug domain-containing protein [Caulobacteraceae bacterium]
MICGVALAAGGQALAQEGGSQVSEIVVTGSRIPQPNLTSVSPIQVVTDQTFKLSGATDTIDALNQLPQVSVGNGLNNTPNPLSSSGGFTTIDLRNLGTVRTLVLEDGKRLMPGDPTLGGEAPDLDTIPTALIDRVDLVTGGASAVYGSDAIAGVVKHNFEGVQVDLQYSGDWHGNGNDQMQGLEKAFGAVAPSGTTWDGATWDASVAVGANSPDGKGNVTAYVTYRHQEPSCSSTATTRPASWRNPAARRAARVRRTRTSSTTRPPASSTASPRGPEQHLHDHAQPVHHAAEGVQRQPL